MQHNEEIRKELDTLQSGLEKKKVYELESWLTDKHRAVYSACLNDQGDADLDALERGRNQLVQEIFEKLTKSQGDQEPSAEAKRKFLTGLHAIQTDVQQGSKFTGVEKASLLRLLVLLSEQCFVNLDSKISQSGPAASSQPVSTVTTEQPTAVTIKPGVNSPSSSPRDERSSKQFLNSIGARLPKSGDIIQVDSHPFTQLYTFGHEQNRFGHNRLQHQGILGQHIQRKQVLLDRNLFTNVRGDGLKRAILELFVMGLVQTINESGANPVTIREKIAELESSYECSLLSTRQASLPLGSFFKPETDSYRVWRSIAQTAEEFCQNYQPGNTNSI